MPSRIDEKLQPRRWGASALLAAALVLSTNSIGAAESPTPTEEQIKIAIEKVRKDPNLSTERKTNTLKWVDKSKPREKSNPAGWKIWLRELFAWIGSTGRVLFWTAIALLVAVLAVFLIRYLRNFASPRPKLRAASPTHVRDFDIRPESLPADVGAAALALWNDGQHRAALALLYRGLLSRLVHVHAIAIRQSSTEAECLELARARLREPQMQYVSSLLRVWQLAVYGGKDPLGEEVRQLCESFAALFAREAASQGPQL